MDGRFSEIMTTYVEPEIKACIENEAREKGVSMAAVQRWALEERYRRQLEKYRGLVPQPASTA